VLFETSICLQDSAVQEAPENVPLDGEDGQASGAAEGYLPHAAQQAATAASASPEVSAMDKQEGSFFQHFFNTLHSCAGVLVSFNHQQSLLVPVWLCLAG